MRSAQIGTSIMVLLSFAPCGRLAAQPSFEVASVRLNRSGARNGSMEFSKSGERFTATNMSFGAFVLIAYGITVRQLSGAPQFLSETYDVVAKADHPVRPDEMMGMLQALLVDRFKLVVRRETKDVPVYALTVAKGGPKLRESVLPDDQRPTPRIPARAGGTETGHGHLVFKYESMDDFAWALSRTGGLEDRVVVDDTGLKGAYDFELIFERDSAMREGPSIFSALQEQLGLKLESKKAPVEFLTIEHVERPSEN